MTTPSQATTNRPIVAVETFISSIRDSGYKNLASALAELVDNSIEANANNVSITISPEPATKITVIDDGCGMPPSTLQRALQFGGSTRFNSREGAGRYGMGLPCSALSQAKRVDVYTWQTPSRVWWTYLDADRGRPCLSSGCPSRAECWRSRPDPSKDPQRYDCVAIRLRPD